MNFTWSNSLDAADVSHKRRALDTQMWVHFGSRSNWTLAMIWRAESIRCRNRTDQSERTDLGASDCCWMITPDSWIHSSPYWQIAGRLRWGMHFVRFINTKANSSFIEDPSFTSATRLVELSETSPSAWGLSKAVRPLRLLERRLLTAVFRGWSASVF